MWMGLSQGQTQGQGRSQSTANEEDDFMDLGVPGGLPIRSSRSYDRSMSTPGVVPQGQTGAVRSPGASSASGDSPSLPPKLGRANSRQIKIQGYSAREPEPGRDIPPLPAPPSAARRFCAIRQSTTRIHYHVHHHYYAAETSKSSSQSVGRWFPPPAEVSPPREVEEVALEGSTGQ